MHPSQLTIVTPISNYPRWSSRIRLACDAIEGWLEAGVNVIVVECAYGERPFVLSAMADKHPRLKHVGVRARTVAWNKESLCNIGIRAADSECQYFGVFDADVHFRSKTWALDMLHELQMYAVVQPWETCYDLGPNDEHIATHYSFARQAAKGAPLIPADAQPRWWKGDGGPYDYPHSGYAWGFTRAFLDRVGGMLAMGGMGSGDHHMALAIVGLAYASMPGGTHDNYRAHVHRWEARARQACNGRIGFVPGTIEHRFHGRKPDRKYVPRWQMFLDHGFNPDEDLTTNSYGVVEFSGNKPGLERQFDVYMRERNEDTNTLY